MEPIVGMFSSMVESNFQRLKSIVAGMKQEELEYKVSIEIEQFCSITEAFNVDIGFIELKESYYQKN
ncbi:Uncharacterised protein [Niallia circulans]|uniref:hypothetical protein n=1 Tax=Niallia circulans TaxID=1397 RepID=UPI00077C83A8|nr:hypothetical protein [Niallia circulans]MDR4315933.1 hypothetical protein [Niallia circulans]MED3841255.1 hypothetical protein [Niallia circulans]MED4244807.1 hypothetical protein [Niallia circulans]MED4249710.1 hypothetical protein [Niallia circulans]QKH60395.1 hypothetical protein FOC77_06880 [Niallia circulans]